jgi:hypothetical protein
VLLIAAAVPYLLEQDFSKGFLSNINNNIQELLFRHKENKGTPKSA